MKFISNISANFSEFKACRGHGIERKNYTDDLMAANWQECSNDQESRVGSSRQQNAREGFKPGPSSSRPGRFERTSHTYRDEAPRDFQRPRHYESECFKKFKKLK